MLYVPRENSLLPSLGTEARSTAAPGDFTQTGLEMSQKWALGNPFLFTSHAPESISVHFFISIHFSRSRVPAQTWVVVVGGPFLLSGR